MVKSAITAAYPTSVVTDAQIGVFTNVETTYLTADATAAATSLSINGFGAVEANMFAALRSENGFEIVLVTAVDAGARTVTVTRAQDGTTAVAHPQGTQFRLSPVTAKTLNQIREELQAVQTRAGTGAFTAGAVIFATSTTAMGTDATNFLWDDANNQLQLAATGSGAGLLVGGDAHLYRGAANRLDLATGDSLNVVSGSLQFAGTTLVNASGHVQSPTLADATDTTKRVALGLTGVTTAVTGNLAFTFTTAKTLTLPDATDTLVARTTTDTLTNKTLTSPILNTSLVLNQTTEDYTLTWDDPAAARALSIADPGGNDSFVFLAATQALTGKTLNGLTVTTTTGTLTVANGKTLTSNATLTLAGTDGKTLTTNASLTLAGTDAKTLTLSDTTTLATDSITFAGTEVLTLAAAKNVTFADAFATSGAFGVTLTATALTNVTLPTTGTLATLAGTETLSNKTLASPTITGSLTFDNQGAGTDPVLLSSSTSQYLDLTGTLRIDPGTSPDTALALSIAALTSAGTRNSHGVLWIARSFDASAHAIEWLSTVSATSNAGASTWRLRSRVDGAGFAERLAVTDAGLLNAVGGLQVAGTTLFNSSGQAAVTLAAATDDALDLGTDLLGWRTLYLSGATAPTAANTGQVGYGSGGLQLADGSNVRDVLMAPTAVPSETALTNNTNRTPSTTRGTLVTITVDYNTVPLATTRTGSVTVGATTYGTPVIIRNADTLSANRLTAFCTVFVPKNTAYKINMDSTTNLTLRAVETTV